LIVGSILNFVVTAFRSTSTFAWNHHPLGLQNEAAVPVVRPPPVFCDSLGPNIICYEIIREIASMFLECLNLVTRWM
jgi:hypothetical protein